MNKQEFYRNELIKYKDDNNTLQVGRYIRRKKGKGVIRVYEPLGHYIEIDFENIYHEKESVNSIVTRA